MTQVIGSVLVGAVVAYLLGLGVVAFAAGLLQDEAPARDRAQELRRYQP
jgi:cytochrome c biogenesis protein CcdA